MPFARGHGLPSPSQRVFYAGAAGRGLGGASRADIGRLAELRLGSIRLAAPVALFSRDTSGFFSWSGRAGVIGTEVLRRFRVLLDGRPPGAAHGIDTNEGGEGTVTHPRLYQLVRQRPPIGEHTVEISFPEAGAQAFVFTFG